MSEKQKLPKEIDAALIAAETNTNTLAFSYAQEGDYGRVESLTLQAASIRKIRIGIAELMKPTQAVQVSAGTAKSQSEQATYPSFHVQGDALVFRNYRRGEHGVYVHRVPKEQFEKIAKAFASVMEKGRYIATPKLIEACGDMPAYLPRVVVAMLKKMKIITGPRGAVMFQGNDLESTMLNKWNELSTAIVGAPS